MTISSTCARHHLQYFLWWCFSKFLSILVVGCILSQGLPHCLRKHFYKTKISKRGFPQQRLPIVAYRLRSTLIKQIWKKGHPLVLYTQARMFVIYQNQGKCIYTVSMKTHVLEPKSSIRKPLSPGWEHFPRQFVVYCKSPILLKYWEQFSR